MGKTKKCKKCRDNIGNQQHKLICITCLSIFHRICFEAIPNAVYHSIKNNFECKFCRLDLWVAERVEDFSICHKCELPFEDICAGCPADILSDILNENSLVNAEDLKSNSNVVRVHVVEDSNTTTAGIELALPSVTEYPKFGRGMGLGHLNVNGLRSKIHEIRHFMSVSKFKIFGCSESNLNENINSNLVNISGFTLLREDRNHKYKGGVALYISENLSYERISINVKFPVNSSVMVVRVTVKFSKPFIVVLIYCPPDENIKKDFISSLYDLYHLLLDFDLELILMGDLNINLLINTGFPSKLKIFLKYFNLKQIIEEPTRITSKSESLIDHIIVSRAANVAKSGVFSLTGSDHRCTFFVRKLNCIKLPPTLSNFRAYAKVDWEKVNKEVVVLNWGCLLNFATVNCMTDYFCEVLQKISDREAPLKKRMVKGEKVPWLNGEIISNLNLRNTAHEKALSTKENRDFKEYNRLRNRTSNLMNRSYNNYFVSSFEKLIESKPIFKVLDQLKGKGREVKPDINLIVNNVRVEKEELVADAFAESLLVASDGNDLDEVFEKEYLESISGENCELPDEEIIIDPELIKLALKDFKFKGSNEDPIPAFFLKMTINSLLIPLSILFTFFVKVGKIPDHFKKATVIPLYKSRGSLNDPNSYRPISNLSPLSKLFERVLKIYIMRKVEKGKMLGDEQHGFRKNRSCMTALSVFTQFIHDSIDNGEIVLVVFVDLKKAFDLVSHSLLLLKLRDIYKLNYFILRTLFDYFKNRVIRIKLKGFLSTDYSVVRGVPQGSVLGPTLFILFFNAIGDALKVFNFLRYTLFADDLALYFNGSDVLDMLKRMEMVMVAVDSWCRENGLKINISKTKFLIFHGVRKKIETLPNITVNSEIIERVNSFKYLGVIMDPQLTFKDHFQKVDRNVASAIGGIISVKRQLTSRVFALMIKTYIFPHIDYCLEIWGHSCDVELGKLQAKINNLLCAFFEPQTNKFYSKAFWAKNKSGRERDSAIRESKLLHKKVDYMRMYDRCNIFLVRERLIFITLVNVFKMLNFGNDVIALEKFYCLTERSKGSGNLRLEIKAHKKESFKNSIMYASAYQWNLLPKKIRRLDISVAGFRKSLAQYLLEKREDEFVISRKK